MKSIVLTVIFALTLSRCYSQHDTIYLDANFKTSTSSSAKYFRLITNSENKFIVKEYYANSNSLMKVEDCSSINPIIRNGNSLNYYNSGLKSAEGKYLEDKKYGI